MYLPGLPVISPLGSIRVLHDNDLLATCETSGSTLSYQNI